MSSLTKPKSIPICTTTPIFFFFLLINLTLTLTLAKKPHIINFRSPNLYPEAVTYDPSAQNFLVGSLRHRSILSVSDAVVVDSLISDPSLPPNSTFLGLSLDPLRRRLHAVVRSSPSLSSSSSFLAAYDLFSRRRLFLSPLPSSAANDVAINFSGTAFVTDSAGNVIWKVTAEGEPSIFSKSSVFMEHPVDHDAPHSYCGLNGIAYVSKGYLLVVQSNTGKMFKVDVESGRAKTVILANYGDDGWR